MKRYILYSSKDCCLCDQAFAVLEQYMSESAFQVSKVDIYQDKSLLIQYRYTIPVLKDEETLAELAWPFTLDSLRSWASEGAF